MKPKERRARIFDLIRQDGRVGVDRLVTEFNSSAETIRRDLKKLAKLGKIQKIHGGAMLPGATEEGPYQERLAQNVKAKRKVGKLACALISAGETLYIDTGSSTLIFAEELAQVNDLTVITNSAQVAKVMSTPLNNSRVFLLGGEYQADSRYTTGTMVIDQLSKFYAHHAILACGALDAKRGIMTFDFNEASIARSMLERAGNVIVLSDSSKFNRSASHVIGSLQQIDQLVCESPPGEVLYAALKENNVQVVC